MAVTVEGALSQLKWLWFHHRPGRKLSDMQVYESAIHGPLSSLNLIRQTRIGLVYSLVAASVRRLFHLYADAN